MRRGRETTVIIFNRNTTIPFGDIIWGNRPVLQCLCCGIVFPLFVTSTQLHIGGQYTSYRKTGTHPCTNTLMPKCLKLSVFCTKQAIKSISSTVASPLSSSSTALPLRGKNDLTLPLQHYSLHIPYSLLFTWFSSHSISSIPVLIKTPIYAFLFCFLYLSSCLLWHFFTSLSR